MLLNFQFDDINLREMLKYLEISVTFFDDNNPKASSTGYLGLILGSGHGRLPLSSALSAPIHCNNLKQVLHNQLVAKSSTSTSIAASSNNEDPFGSSSCPNGQNHILQRDRMSELSRICRAFKREVFSLR